MAATATLQDGGLQVSVPAAEGPRQPHAERGGRVGRLARDLTGRMSERSLVKRLKKGEEAAFRELVKTHQQRVLGVTLRMLGDHAEAEDVAQEVFVTVFRQIHRFRGDSKLGTWLYRIACNHSINRLKLKATRVRKQSVDYDELRTHGLADPTTEASGFERPDEMAEARETERVVQRLLAGLSEEHRVVVVLRDLEGMSYEEITQVLELPVGTVKSRLHRARAELARGFKAHQEASQRSE